MLPSPSEVATHPECAAQEEVVLLSSIDSGFSNEVTITDNEEENHHIIMPLVMQENFTEESQKNAMNSCEGCHSEIPTEVLQEKPLEACSTFPDGGAQEEEVLLSSLDSGFSNEVTITDNEEENHHMPPVMQEKSTEESQKNATNSCEDCHSEILTEVPQEIPLEDRVSEKSRFLNSLELAQNISGATSQATSCSSPPQAEEECRAEIHNEEMSQHIPPLISPIPEPQEEVEDRAGPSRPGISRFSFSSFGDCQVGVKRKRVDDRLSAIEDTLRQHTNRFDQLHESLERLKDYFDEQVPEDYFGRFIGRFIYDTPGLRSRTRLIRAIMHLVADEIEAEESEMSNSEL